MGSRARLICEVALATYTAPSQWWEETDEALATVLDLLEAQADRIRREGKRRG